MGSFAWPLTAGLVVGDIDWTNRIVTIERQSFPRASGLSIKPPKGRRARQVSIIEPLEPVLRRLTMRQARSLPLLRGPHGGVITTATLRAATGWDELVASLGLRGGAVMTCGMRVQPGSRTRASRSTL
ncbi:hypothetical protein [Demequina sp.]|uniref:hypothetical protein n=1 Tax=Demequina sp. TaxID=2050685 RepID=UPI0025C01D13|nr:hypothetical protein [Demequina sp.]